MSLEHKFTFFIHNVHFVSKINVYINKCLRLRSYKLASVRESLGVSKTEDANALIQTGDISTLSDARRKALIEKKLN